MKASETEVLIVEIHRVADKMSAKVKTVAELEEHYNSLHYALMVSIGILSDLPLQMILDDLHRVTLK